MKFFYLNNTLCSDCGRCEAVCPTGAIYFSSDKRYINYDKCTLCGNCMKQCGQDAVTLETLEKVVIDIDQTELYRNRIRTLEHDLARSREQAKYFEHRLADVVRHSPVAMFIVDRNNILVTANKPLTALVDVDPVRAVAAAGDFSGESLEVLLPSESVKLIRMTANDKRTEVEVVSAAGKDLLAIVALLDDGMLLGFLQDLSDRNVVGEQIVAQLRETIDRKMSMVQKIGFLLGEEVSEVVNNLNKVIKIVESSGEADKQ